MSRFSEILSHFIFDKQIRIPDMAVYCNMNRSTLYKVINGKRSASSLAQVKTMAQYLHMTPDETAKLLEAYQITRLGEKAYYRMKSVDSFLRGFSVVSKNTFNWNGVMPFNQNGPVIENLNSQYAIIQVVEKILKHEKNKAKGKVYLNIQPDTAPYVFDILLNTERLESQTKLEIEHILYLHGDGRLNDRNEDLNITYLQSVLPLFLHNHYIDYRPYYYYEKIPDSDIHAAFFGFVLFTEDYLLVMDETGSKGLMIKDAETIQICIEKFEEKKRFTRPMMEMADNWQILDPDIACREYEIYYRVDPFLLPHMSEQIMKKYILDSMDNQSGFLQRYRKYKQNYFHRQTEQILYCSLNGIRRVLDKDAQFFSSILKPLSQEDRLHIMRRFYEYCRTNETADLRILKENTNTDFFRGGGYYLYDPNHLFFVYDIGNEHMVVEIKNETLQESFQYYFLHLTEDAYYAKEEGLDLLYQELQKHTK